VRTPAAVLSALSAAVADASKSPDMAENLAKFANEPDFQTPEQFTARVKADIERWGPVVKASGFVADD
jgi:tripartite-type tricarboxylate transporter receptor subunit TctC